MLLPYMILAGAGYSSNLCATKSLLPHGPLPLPSHPGSQSLGRLKTQKCITPLADGSKVLALVSNLPLVIDRAYISRNVSAVTAPPTHGSPQEWTPSLLRQFSSLSFTAFSCTCFLFWCARSFGELSSSINFRFRFCLFPISL